MSYLYAYMIIIMVARFNLSLIGRSFVRPVRVREVQVFRVALRARVVVFNAKLS
jgi:hypothetical protein